MRSRGRAEFVETSVDFHDRNKNIFLFQNTHIWLLIGLYNNCNTFRGTIPRHRYTGFGKLDQLRAI